ncbi:MAG: hypothetical protein KUG81_08615, partial [Gammaproteobacteria bacterium]|nr:hypothetical protein [Gammaproteobacteria bacterium]
MNKSRHQSLYDFLECLQQEYITVEVRSKIYPSVSDKKYYKKVMGYKVEKIDDIASRNELPTIFNNENKRQTMYSEVCTMFGVPNFAYRDEADKEKFFEGDLLNYFSEGAEVRVLQEDEAIDIAVIVDCDQLVDKWTQCTAEE